MSGAGVSPAEAVDDRVAGANKGPPDASHRRLTLADEAGNAEALVTLDLQASSDYLLELIVNKLRQFGQLSHGAFLKRLLRGLTSIEVGEEESIVHWEKILARRNELTEKLGRPVLLRTAAVDYFGELQLLRKPILLEYEELEKLRYDAATDSLTGLKNRRTFEEYLGREIHRSRRYGASFALLLLDLRRFKLVNDTYGHATGDEILRSVARACIETTRSSDISCRIGGDEFAILLPQADRSSAETLAERIARKFEAYARLLAPVAPVGIDYGIAIFPEDGEGATKLFQTADKNLYESKERPSQALGEPVASAWGPAPAVKGRAPEVDVAMHAGDWPPPLDPERSPDFGLKPKEIPPPEGARCPRRYERIPVEGAHRLGVVRFREKSKVVKVLDLSLGGVGLLVDDFDVPDSFPARIQAPFLPDGEVILHRVYCRQLPDGKIRVGCSFKPIFAPGTA